jgi:hypothetical protein
MATLIQLTFPARKPTLRADGKSADILMFTGVRYERSTAAEAVKPKRKRKSRAKAAKQILIAR